MQSHTLNSRSLFRSLLLERFRWRLLIMALALAAACLGLLAPYAQKQFVDELLLGQTPWVWMGAAFFFALCSQALTQGSLWFATRESLISQKALGDTAYRRVLEGPGGLVGRSPAGEAVSLFAVDIPGAASFLDQALVMMSTMIFPLLLAPIALNVFFAIPFWACGAVILFLASINLYLARRQSRFFHRYKQMAAERTGLVSEWVQNIRTLRILGWVEAVEKRIFKLRRNETLNRKSMVTNGQMMNAIASSSTFALNVVAVLFLLRIRGPASSPTAGEILSLLWILGVFLARPLRQMPWSLVITLDALSSVRRLEKALALPILKPVVENSSGPESAYALEVRGLNLESGGTELLKEIDLKIKPGQLVAIVGEVGSGKSLLLQSLIGATAARFRSFSLNGKPGHGPLDPAVRGQLAFVSQEGFTMSASLRENVLFSYLRGAKVDPATDEGVVRSLATAQFQPAGERMLDGLDTEIGERGVNLSGGQRQRVGLARVHHVGRSILLLDDCLSAVDVDTERRLIDELICGEWKGRARLLATHRMAILPLCDQVIFLENGAIALQGHYNQLLGYPKFRDFVQREEVKPGPETVSEVKPAPEEEVTADD